MNTALDAIILAGDRGAALPVGDCNKALLPIGGQPLLQYVLDALAAVTRIRRIVLVGPVQELRPFVDSLEFDKPLELLEQRDTAYQNFWSAFTHLGGDGPEDRDRPILLVAADTPLMTAAEVNEFLDRCDLTQLDYCVGMTDEQHLARFYPTSGAPGIRMRYLHLADGSLRVNNLHLVKPLRVDNRAYIEEIYAARYQSQLWNMLRSAWGLVRRPGVGWRGVYLYLLFQLAELGYQLNWQLLCNFSRKRLTREKVCTLASAVLRTRAGIVETTVGGCAIDVDNARDYATLQARWQEFRRLLP